MGCSGGGKVWFVQTSMKRCDPSAFPPHPSVRASSGWRSAWRAAVWAATIGRTNRRLPPRETRQPKDQSRIPTLSVHAPRGRGGRSPHVERGAVLRGRERASADADRQQPRRRDPPGDDGAPGGTDGAWGPHTRCPGPTCPDGSLGIWSSILQDTWANVREAAALGDWLRLPSDTAMRRREEVVV